MSAASFLDGLALAATLTGDRGRAAEAGLGPELARALDARIQEIRGADGAGRQRALGAIAVGLRPAIDPRAVLPARGAAIVAAEVPRATGAAWMARAPLPRPGFRASAGLRATLRRWAQAPVDEAGDRARGREALGAALAGGLDAGGLDAGGLDAGGRSEVAPRPGPDAERWAAFARLALATGARRLELALGGMARGGDDRWGRAGRELAALWEHGCRG